MLVLAEDVRRLGEDRVEELAEHLAPVAEQLELREPEHEADDRQDGEHPERDASSTGEDSWACAATSVRGFPANVRAKQRTM